MNEINQIKNEARQLLEEVNHAEGSVYNFDHTGENAFKKRLNQLRQKVALLQANPVILYSGNFTA